MECNKEEALKAKEIAISKMQSNDFFGAQKFILKAQKLFPDLENINQMIAVCEVHSSASRKVNGEMDWYGILQVEPTANELAIKKQYRKLALLLHPDKNKFVRAEAAFKLIGEAHKILLDQSKRSLHDVLRRQNTGPLQPRQTTNSSKHNPPFNMQMRSSCQAASNSYTKPGVLNQEHHQTSAFPNAETFWTMCNFCGTKYKYYVVVKNKQIYCQICKKNFFGIELKLQSVHPGFDTGNTQTNFGVPQHVFPGSDGIRQDSYYKHVFPGYGCEQDGVASSTVGQTNSRLKVNSVLGSMEKKAQMTEDVKPNQINSVHIVKEEQNTKSTAGKENKKRGKRIEPETIEARGSVFEEVIDIHDQQPGQHVVTNGSHIASQLGGQKKEPCKDASSNTILVNPFSKRPRKGKSCTHVAQNEKSSFECLAAGFACKKVDNQKEGILFEGSGSVSEQAETHKVSKGTQGKRAARNNLKSDPVSNARAGFKPRSKTSSNEEFNKFEKKRAADNFAVNQIWSVYDDFDGMPRLYARIKKVLSPGFKLQVTWLKNLPLNDNEIEWSKEEFPLACGNFRLGKCDYIHDQHIFSSLMTYEKGVIRNSYAIYPKKGEIWALFKNWDVNWTFGAETDTVYEYEVAEVLSDYAKGGGISIFPLVKVEGSTCLFARDMLKIGATIWLSYHELLKFSHKIPSQGMTGEDTEGVPQGLFQLDAAALPSNFNEIFPSIKLQSLRLGVEGSHSITDGFLSAATRLDQNTLSSPKITDKMEGMNFDSSEKQYSSQTFCEEPMKPQENAANNSRQGNLSPDDHVNDQPDAANNQANVRDKDVSAENLRKSSASENGKSMPQSYRSPVTFGYPDSQFHDFDEERSFENIECGQIWAIFSDIDRFPNYYGCIKKVDSEKSIVHVKWLDACLTQDILKRWRKEGLPIGCGRFKFVSESSVYHTTDVFSHLVQVKPTGNKGQYDIYPSTGEIWAVFKNWNSGWTSSHFENCEYVMVEILGFTSSGIEVIALAKVEGYRAVFKYEQDAKIEIPASEYLRFSHQVPAFQLTEERGGKLRGYLELDPASVPDELLIQDTD